MNSNGNTGNGSRLFTVSQVAKLLGIDGSRVRRLAEGRGIGRKLGMQWVFTENDIEDLRERPQGNAGQRLTAEYRRLDMLNAITGALADMVSTKGMSSKDYETAKGAADKARQDGKDEDLLEMLRTYVPDSPRLKESSDK